jgi:hypothetical protein
LSAKATRTEDAFQWLSYFQTYRSFVNTRAAARSALLF